MGKKNFISIGLTIVFFIVLILAVFHLSSIWLATTKCQGNDSSDKMVRVGSLCVDQFESSLWLRSENKWKQIGGFPPCSRNGNDCSHIYARSIGGVLPANDVSWFQAQQACANSGKRLMTNAEWQMAAADTDDTLGNDSPSSCAMNTGKPRVTGSGSCVSRWGVYDMVGNVWEWVGDWIQAGPGFWNPLNDGEITTPEFGEDIVRGINNVEERLPAAIVRGGGYESGDQAGVFALMASYGPQAQNLVIGFRCARPLQPPFIRR